MVSALPAHTFLATVPSGCLYGVDPVSWTPALSCESVEKVTMSKQKRTRRNHTPEFKAETVKLVREGGRSVGQVSQDLDLADSLVRIWLKQAEVDDGKGPAGVLTTAEKAELSQLRREVKVLRMEREILKRAATFFAKENA
jgi:transposase